MPDNSLVIIDYGVGNLFSVEKAFNFLGVSAIVTADEEIIASAKKIVLPGVGAFGDCMKNLLATGLVPAIKEKIAAGTPLLGICVGLQILFEGSEESPGVAGLGILPGTVRKINAPGLKIPHIGWNSLKIADQSAEIDLFKGLSAEPYVYFVHSYQAVPADKNIVTATTVYGEEVTAAVACGNVQAAQFHPEKSGDVGLKILENFING